MKTIEEVDKAVEKLIEISTSDEKLQDKLKGAKDWMSRGEYLEDYVLEHLEDVGLNRIDYIYLEIGWIFFYEMQKRTGMDYGFCKYFTPAFRNKAISSLTHDLTIDTDNKCSYRTGNPIPALCSGINHEACAILHPELGVLRNEIIDAYARNIVAERIRKRN